MRLEVIEWIAVWQYMRAVDGMRLHNDASTQGGNT